MVLLLGTVLRRPRPLMVARVAALLAVLFLVGGPVLADTLENIAVASSNEIPAPTDEGPEDVPDAHLTSLPAPVRAANPAPGACQTGRPVPSSLPPSGSDFARAARSASADLFGNGLGLRLRC
ncbi:MAG: hypothetical protein JWO38_2581 [Gemmataceae bacterium]|nr:hypothetical protein [Gemmataceae bacterium]